MIFRPHPYSFKQRAVHPPDQRGEPVAGQGEHRRRGAPCSARTRPRCRCSTTFNTVDALVTDVSSVAADFLYSGKPFAVVDVGEPDADPLVGVPDDARPATCCGRGSAIQRRCWRDMLRRDPMAAVRQQLRTYYLGDFPSDHYAEAFLGQVRATVAEGAARRVGMNLAWRANPDHRYRFGRAGAGRLHVGAFCLPFAGFVRPRPVLASPATPTTPAGSPDSPEPLAQSVRPSRADAHQGPVRRPDRDGEGRQPGRITGATLPQRGRRPRWRGRGGREAEARRRRASRCNKLVRRGPCRPGVGRRSGAR